MCAKIAYGFWKKRSTVSFVCSLSCEKCERNWHSHLKSQKQCVHPSILLLFTILAKEIMFSDEAHFNLGGYAKLSRLGYRKPARIHWKHAHPKRFTVLWGFWSMGIIGPFFFQNEQGEAITVNGWTNFCSQKLKRKIWATFGYTRCFAPCFWRSHYQSQNWCRLATSELRFNTVGLLFVAGRQR